MLTGEDNPPSWDRQIGEALDDFFAQSEVGDLRYRIPQAVVLPGRSIRRIKDDPRASARRRGLVPYQKTSCRPLV